MKFALCLLLFLVPSAFLPSARNASRTQTIRFEPRLGLKLKKSYAMTTELELVEESTVVDGEEGEDLGDYDVSLVSETEVVFLDELLEVGAGRPTKLMRTFETLAESSTTIFSGTDVETEETQEDSESGLEGKRVIFQWDEEDGLYQAAFPADEDGDEDLLLELDGDADFLALLPDDEVEAGDSWSIDLTRWRSIESPGGDLKLIAPSDNPEDDSEQHFYENLTGEVEATYEGQVEGGRNNLARITLRGSLHSQIESNEEIVGESDYGPSGTLSATSRFKVEVEGELLWDTAAGHAHSLRLESVLSSTTTGEQSMEFGGEKSELTYEQEYTGRGLLEATFEPAE